MPINPEQKAAALVALVYAGVPVDVQEMILKNNALGKAIEAALSTAEPVGFVYGPDLRYGSAVMTKLKGDVVESHDNSFVNTDTPVYAAHPAPSASEPVTSRNDEAGYVEFLNEDVPYVVRDIQSAVAILTDMETRNVIGYRVYDPDSVFAPQPAQSEAVKALEWIVANPTESNAVVWDVAQTALSAQVQDVAGWQPIETAPKDGTEILVRTEGGCVSCGWDSSCQEWLAGWIGVGIPNRQALGWTPIPAAPAKQDGGE